jgi:phosphohistidine phosphatase
VNLWLLRHAKTVPDPPPGKTDHERPLAPRGRRDADALARRLEDDRLGFRARDLPGLVLCSTAVRTVQTAERVVPGLGDPPVDYRRALYDASPDDVIDELRSLDDEVDTVMVVGHNPTAQILAVSMEKKRDDRRTFPTCALAVYRLPVKKWAEVEQGTGTLLGLFVPPF